jgi:hypothetical protein
MNITEAKFNKFVTLKNNKTELLEEFTQIEIEYMTTNYKELWIRWRI